MNLLLNKTIKTILKFLLVVIVLLSIPNTFQVIWDCGKDFGSNVMKFILSLI